MAQAWQSKQFYDSLSGPLVHTKGTNPRVVISNVFWRVHFVDTPSGKRAWIISDTGQAPFTNCQLLQAAFPGSTVSWGSPGPDVEFPLTAGITPAFGLTVC